MSQDPAAGGRPSWGPSVTEDDLRALASDSEPSARAHPPSPSFEPQSPMPPPSRGLAIPLGKQPVRSFIHHSYRSTSSELERSQWPQYSSYGVREQTAELANQALSECASGMAATPPASSGFEASSLPSPAFPSSNNDPALGNLERSPMLDRRRTRDDADGGQAHKAGEEARVPSYGTFAEHERATERDTEAQNADTDLLKGSRGTTRFDIPRYSNLNLRRVFRCEKWSWRQVVEQGVVQPATYLPSVLLGLLLNILDGLSYGMILFPLGDQIFSDLGPDGLSMFYVSCIVSQLVYSCGGSAFKGGIGSEMIEVVPFFHKMAFTIAAEVGRENPKSVIATTILAYALSSILTGVVFFGLGYLKLGALIGFFPRHILVGCIGGVGWFLVATGFETATGSALEYNLKQLEFLVRPEIIALWLVPLALAVILFILQRFIKSPLFVPLYFMAIPCVFYIVIAAIPNLGVEDLRESRWLFEAPKAATSPWHFYSLYDFKAVHWGALLHTVPAMFALLGFALLHVPINVPALAVSTGQDVNIDHELIAHGLSNALSGFAGSIQNYLVYSNSVLFIRCGGDSRLAGIMLAVGTAGILQAGPAIIGYIPVMVVGALIFLLGIELLKEAVYDTWGKLSKLEYLTIIAIVVTMGAWDFVVGILVGVLLACIAFVVQTSQKSAIRATYSGVIARSTVRRPPVQQRFLRAAGRQIMIFKLAGYMFFGTITSVENRVRDLLEEHNFQQRPTRYVILDLVQVRGIDFSAAEAFIRMRRLLASRNVVMILSGVHPEGDVGSALRASGLWGDQENVQVFEDLNGALESCENAFLAALYAHKKELAWQRQQQTSLDVPKPKGSNHVSIDVIQGSPRRAMLDEAAAETLQHDDSLHTSKWQNFKRPLPLLLSVFQEISGRNEDIWFRALPFFSHHSYPKGTILFKPGDPAREFIIIEDGLLRAEYTLDQGRYHETILAGTTCGELPFFSHTPRTATVLAEKKTSAWVLDEKGWERLQAQEPDVAKELLKVSLTLTSERMSSIVSYVLTSTG